MEKIKEKVVILYDGGDCSDGFGGAWTAWKKFGNGAKYIGVFHQSPIPEGLNNKIIYMIDFTYPEEITRKLIKDNITVTSIDHHVSVLKAIKLTKNYSYSENNSGSVLAWKYFFPKKPIPKLLKYIEDMDLWVNKLPYSKEIFAYHNLFGFEFKTWNKLATELENSGKFKKWAEIGKILLRYEDKLIDFLIKNNTEKAVFDGYKVAVVNSPLFHSQICNRVLNKEIKVGIAWRKKQDKIYVSLRSDGRADVAKLAKKYGGGGHKTSSGFEVKNNKLPWKTIK